MDVLAQDLKLDPAELRRRNFIPPDKFPYLSPLGWSYDSGNSERLRDRLSVTYSPIFIQQYASPEGAFYRLRVGKVSGEDAAKELAQQLRAREGFTTLVFRLDENAASGAN
jgi:hypothetical protein